MEIPSYCLLGLRIPHIQAISGKGDQNIPMPYQIITRHCSHNSSYIMQILSELLELTRQTQVRLDLHVLVPSSMITSTVINYFFKPKSIKCASHIFSDLYDAFA